METDQKLGMLAGVAAVLVVAVVYLSKPLPAVAADVPRAVAVDTTPTAAPASVGMPARPMKRALADD